MIERNGRYLLRQRPPGGHLAGLWEFPGGKLEPGESWEVALVREVREELGVSSSARKLIEEKAFDYPERRVRIRFYWTDIAKGAEPSSREANAPLRWATPEELLSLPSPDANREIIARLASLEPPSAHEHSHARTVAWALWGLPVAFFLACFTWMQLEAWARANGRDLDRIVEQSVPFPLLLGSTRSLVFALFLAFELLIVLAALRIRRL